MGMTYEVLMHKIDSEGKFSKADILWMLEKMEKMDKHLDKVSKDLDVRLGKMEYAQDDHIPGGI